MSDDDEVRAGRPERRKASLRRTLYAVLWSFFGVRKAKDLERDVSELKPLHVVIVGVLVAGPLGFLIGGVVAGSTGALVTKLVDTGIPHRLVDLLRKRAKPGQAVVALLVDDDDSVDSLRRLPGARVVYDN